MSDERLRELERRWRQGGRPDDRLRWWTARARAGDLPPGAEALVARVVDGALTPARVELAAYLGDPRARALALEEVVERVAYGGEPGAMKVVFDEPDLRLDDVLEWIAGLAQWEPGAPRPNALGRGLLATTRAGVDGVASLDLSRLEDEEPWVHDVREWRRERFMSAVPPALDAAAQWLDGQVDVAAVAAHHARLDGCRDGPHSPLVDASRYLLRWVEACCGAGRREGWERPRETALGHWLMHMNDTLLDPRDVRDAVRAALVPWALDEDTGEEAS